MNLLARYNMLRVATLAMVGVSDNVETLKEMASILRVPALTDADAAASLLVLQTLITTHDGTAVAVPDKFVERYQRLNPSASEGEARAMLEHVLWGVVS